jgi:hypothetical protein
MFLFPALAHFLAAASPHPQPLLPPRSTLEFAKSQLEWMNEALVRSLGHSRDNPFSTR